MTTGFRPAAWLPQATAQHSLGVVLSRLELLTPTLSVWCSNQLSYRTVMELCVARNLVLHLLYSFINKGVAKEECGNHGPACLLQYLTSLPDSPAVSGGMEPFPVFSAVLLYIAISRLHKALQKGGVPAAPSGTATLLRLSPNHQFCPRPTLAVTDFRHPRLSWLDGRCVQGPGTYSPRHG